MATEGPLFSLQERLRMLALSHEGAHELEKVHQAGEFRPLSFWRALSQ